MIPWYAPTTLQEWFRRLLSPRSAVLVLLLAVVTLTEWRFAWMEQVAGTYLVTTNRYRPKSGTVWEQGRQSDQARQTLAQYAKERQNVQREAQQAASLAQVVANMDPEKGAMISAEHFVTLYLKLPPVLAQEIVSPYTLLAVSSAGAWERTFFQRQDQNLSIYLLDAKNQVIQRMAIGPVLMGHIEHGEVAIRTGLEQLSDFSDNIYPAELFFTELNALPEEMRERVVAHPEELLRVSGRIRRIGISAGTMGDAVDLGFEVEDLEGPKVILMQGTRADVRRLQRAMEGGFFDEKPSGGEARP
ncbi:MAG: hypothetical protein WAU91_17080 [Desulfatitalea sp.]